MSDETRHWNVCRTVKLGASAERVWEVIGGFYTIHEWCPDISETEVPAEQTATRQLRRIITFPGQPKATEELLSLDNEDFHYRYKWYQGPWGEEVKNYHASLRVMDGDLRETCLVQWQSTFDHSEDAISWFYENSFRELERRFPLKEED